MLLFRAILELMKILAVAVGLRSFANRVVIERRSIGDRLRMPGIGRLLGGASVHVALASTADAWIEIVRAGVIPLAVRREELRRYEWILCSHHGWLGLWLIADLRGAIHWLRRDSAHSPDLLE